MSISQRTAKISLILNGILFLTTLGFMIYAFTQQTVAEQQRMIAVKQTEIAMRNRDLADSVAMVAIIQRDSAIRARDVADSLLRAK